MNPSIGQALRVMTNEQSADVFRSRLIEWTPDDFLIEIPLHTKDNHALRLNEGDPLVIEFHGLDGAVCRFPTVCRAIVLTPVACLRISRPSANEIVREQRRAFVRVTADLLVRIVIPGESGPRSLDVYTRDISGGGVALYVPRTAALRTGMTIHAMFTLPSGNFPVDVKCFVVRVSEPNDSGLVVGSMQFVNIKDAVQQRIIQYTFQRQRLSIS